MLRDDIRRFTELDRRLKLSFGRHNFRASLALGLSLFGHGALHVVWKRNVLDFNRGHLGAPRLGMPVDDILDLRVDRQRLLASKTPTATDDERCCLGRMPTVLLFCESRPRRTPAAARERRAVTHARGVIPTGG